MKYLIKILVILIFTVIISSCKDSLGIDPKVQIEIGNAEGIGDSSPYQYNIDSVISLEIQEEYLYLSKTYPEQWQVSLSKYVKSDIKLDTTDSKIRIWMNLSLDNPLASIPLHPNSKRNDRIINIRIKFKAIIQLSKEYQLDGNEYDWNFCSVKVEMVDEKDQSTFRTFTYNNIQTKILFSMIDKMNLDLKFSTDLSAIDYLETKKLTGEVIIPVTNNK